MTTMLENGQHLAEVLDRLLAGEIAGVSTDSRNVARNELFVALRGDRFDGHDYVAAAIDRGAWGAVVDRAGMQQHATSFGKLRNLVVVDDTLGALQELAKIHREKFTVPVVGVTGSNGKTTTKEMIASILQLRGPVLKNEGNLNNHIGVPLTLLRLRPAHRTAVIEMGMSAAGEIRLLAGLAAPTIGVITNIGPAHLEFLGSMENTADAKGEILDHLGKDATAVLNADDRYFDRLKSKCNCRILSFGISSHADVAATNVRQAGDHASFTMATPGGKREVLLGTVGMHNIANALAAGAAAFAAGMSIDEIKQGLEAFRPVSGRSEIKAVKNRTVLADYYNANPASMEAALASLVSLAAGKNSVAVLGDMLELGPLSAEIHRSVGAVAARSGVTVLITLGDLGREIGNGAVDAGMPRSRVYHAADHEEAARFARELAQPGDAVLIKGSRGMKMEKILEAF